MFESRNLRCLAMSMPPRVKEAVDELLGSSLPPLVTVERVTQLLLRGGLAYKQQLKPSEMLVHPSNKGGQMLSMRDVWVKGHKIYTLYFRKQLLTSSYCFEFAFAGDCREKQVGANAALHEQSGGCLASVTEEERFLSVSSSHTTAWLKAMHQGCEAPGPELAAQLSLADPKCASIMHVLEHGWEWVVLNATVEVTWPTLPSFLATALNASNNNQRAMSEVECAAQLAQDLSLGVPLLDAMEHLKKCDPSCLRSLPCIGDFVCKYGGGEQMPLIKFFGSLQRLGSQLSVFHLAQARFMARSWLVRK